MIVGDRLGDNAQVETLVAALGIPVERKYVRVADAWTKRKPRVKASLHHIELAASDLLEGPWPDLVITVGRRLSMVALWIQRQSGGRTRLVLVGKPSGAHRHFSLIITSAEVQIAPAPNVLRIGMPLLRVDETRVAEAAEAWRDRLEKLPRPLIGMLVGGPTNPFVFNASVRDRLLRTAHDIVSRDGGTPYVTTSPRTPPKIVAALREGLPPEAQFFEWRRDAPDNPYHALLGLADGFIVTGDSISMLVEVAKLGKPLGIFPLPYGVIHKLDQVRREGAHWLYEPEVGKSSDGLRRTIISAGGALGVLPRTRDFSALHGLLIGQGLAGPAEEPLRAPEGEVPSDLPVVVERIHALLNE